MFKRWCVCVCVCVCVFQDAREDNGVAFAVPVRREAESTYLRGNTSPQVSYGLGHIAGLSSVRLRGGGGGGVDICMM